MDERKCCSGVVCLTHTASNTFQSHSTSPCVRALDHPRGALKTPQSPDRRLWTIPSYCSALPYIPVEACCVRTEISTPDASLASGSFPPKFGPLGRLLRPFNPTPHTSNTLQPSSWRRSATSSARWPTTRPSFGRTRRT